MKGAELQYQTRIIEATRLYSYQQKPTECATRPSSHFSNGRVSPAACFVWLPENEAGYFVSKGPWWVDPNHEMLADGNGYGHVNVIAFSRPGEHRYNGFT